MQGRCCRRSGAGACLWRDTCCPFIACFRSFQLSCAASPAPCLGWLLLQEVTDERLCVIGVPVEEGDHHAADTPSAPTQTPPSSHAPNGHRSSAAALPAPGSHIPLRNLQIRMLFAMPRQSVARSDRPDVSAVPSPPSARSAGTEDAYTEDAYTPPGPDGPPSPPASPPASLWSAQRTGSPSAAWDAHPSDALGADGGVLSGALGAWGGGGRTGGGTAPSLFLGVSGAARGERAPATPARGNF